MSATGKSMLSEMLPASLRAINARDGYRGILPYTEISREIGRERYREIRPSEIVVLAGDGDASSLTSRRLQRTVPALKARPESGVERSRTDPSNHHFLDGAL